MTNPEYLLFACHSGMFRDSVQGIIMQEHVLPLAISPMSYGENSTEDGIHSLWEYHAGVEPFFSALGLDHVPANGLWVAVIHNPGGNPNDSDSWDHLDIQEVRRPTETELQSFVRGECPWPHGILL